MVKILEADNDTAGKRAASIVWIWKTGSQVLNVAKQFR